MHNLKKLLKGGLKIAVLIMALFLLVNHPGIRFLYLTDIWLTLKYSDTRIKPELVAKKIRANLLFFDLTINKNKTIPTVFLVNHDDMEKMGTNLLGLYVDSHYLDPKIFLNIESDNIDEVLTHEIFHYLIRNYQDVEENLVEELTFTTLYNVTPRILPYSSKADFAPITKK